MPKKDYTAWEKWLVLAVSLVVHIAWIAFTYYRGKIKWKVNFLEFAFSRLEPSLRELNLPRQLQTDPRAVDQSAMCCAFVSRQIGKFLTKRKIFPVGCRPKCVWQETLPKCHQTYLPKVVAKNAKWIVNFFVPNLCLLTCRFVSTMCNFYGNMLSRLI